MYTSQYRRKKAKAFGDALDQFDAYKIELAQQLKSGIITDTEYQQKLEAKAEELDL